MKIGLFTGIFFISLMVFSSLAFSQEEVSVEGDVSVDDSSISYFFDKIKLSFTFNKEEKIERALEMAEKRLEFAQANVADDPQKAEKARKR